MLCCCCSSYHTSSSSSSYINIIVIVVFLFVNCRIGSKRPDIATRLTGITLKISILSQRNLSLPSLLTRDAGSYTGTKSHLVKRKNYRESFIISYLVTVWCKCLLWFSYFLWTRSLPRQQWWCNAKPLQILKEERSGETEAAMFMCIVQHIASLCQWGCTRCACARVRVFGPHTQESGSYWNT